MSFRTTLSLAKDWRETSNQLYDQMYDQTYDQNVDVMDVNSMGPDGRAVYI